MKKEVWYIFGFLALLISFIFDNQIVSFITGNRITAFNEFFIWISYFGASVIIFILMSSLFMYEEKKREWIPVLWSSFIVALLIGFLIKWGIARLRPYETLNIINLVSANGFSFPSNHAIAAFAALPVLDKEYPNFKWFWLIIAIVIIFSRVYLGVHYLSDVIAGAFIGFSIGNCFIFMEKKYKLFKKWKI
jgi:undecaprenyl-diphosphatase